MQSVPAFLTVLLVEDSRLCAERFRLMARACNIRLRWAESLTEANWHMRTYRPEALLIDVGLADGNGLDLIRRLRYNSPDNVPIYALSAEPDHIDAAFAAGATQFIHKPNLTLAAFAHLFGAQVPSTPHPGVLISAALRSDLAQGLEALKEGSFDYAARFLHGIAQDSADKALQDAARQLGAAPSPPALMALTTLLQTRLAESGHALGH